MRKGKGKNSKLLPNSLRIISSCIRTVSTNASTAVRSASASVAASISSSGDDRKEQVLWAGFDKVELGSSAFRRVLLLGYLKGFQVFDVEDASGLSELVSRRDGPVTFLQMLSSPADRDGSRKNKLPHPILVVVGGNEDERISSLQYTGQGLARYSSESSSGNFLDPPLSVRFYSMRSNEYVKVIDFKSPVLMVRCSPRVVAIGLEEQIYCFDTLTLEKKFIVVTYPVPRVGDQGGFGINTGYGPMSVGSRWLAYPPNRPFLLNTGRVSPKTLASSVSPSTSPGSSSAMARYAVESSRNLAAGLLTLGDIGYKKLSKYYPELLPDSPSSPGWKAGKLAASEPENAGVVVVKDLISLEVVSQFRAHTSPISALCFDPSGTLLVTASIHGNNINIFRIMPCNKCGGSGSGDWSTSYVHLYKLYRGITSAVIQDICFSHYSQWIAILSTRGTCHIFVLSPFGGDDGFQTLYTPGRGTSLCLASTPPWWSTSSFAINEQQLFPPPTCTPSVVSRIKCNDSGLLNSVSNAAASMVGKLWVPSGAIAAVFHNANSGDVKSSSSSLEHILVYTPSGFVVQHEIMYSLVGPEQSEGQREYLSSANPQSEELRVKVEPVQWWDVCRRMDNMEREECISGSIFDGTIDAEIEDETKLVFGDNPISGDKKLVKNNSLKCADRSHWYLSNAEVQINSCRIPIWQKSKMHFHVMEPPSGECYSDGEFELEMVSSHEIEMKHKDLLPIFDNFPRSRSGWTERSIPSEGKNTSASTSSCQAREKTNEASILCHSKPPSFSSTESSEGDQTRCFSSGSSRQMDNLLDLDHMSIVRSPVRPFHTPTELKITARDESKNPKVPLADPRSKPISMPLPPKNAPNAKFLVDNGSISSSDSPENEPPPLNVVENTDSGSDVLVPLKTEKKEVDFAQFFKEGYCNNKLEFGEAVNDEMDDTGGSNNSHHEDEKGDEEEGWIGGMFDFSEEASISTLHVSWLHLGNEHCYLLETWKLNDVSE
ncbi:homolog of yeast autophagy 18 (ATG18) G [Striga asiatica]|uniref:Homolog of yeast autophagy 18 (ATG18) G n=1 Tax=Striga asiatica TaxID=4170 RepID=A0A5A7NWB3_STRAF|nr:homolog of yeast autophagy 18 (ATG18) G [Striga asiatica]